MSTVIKGGCHEVYSTFLVCLCVMTADLEKHKTAAGNQSQLSKLSIIDIVEEYVWRGKQDMPWQHQKPVHHIIFPQPKHSVLQVGKNLKDYCG